MKPIFSRQHCAFISTAAFLIASSAFADALIVHAPGRAELQLDQTITLRGTLQVPAGFKGDVALTSDTSALPQGANEVSLALTPNTMHVATASDSMTEIPFQISVRSQPGSHSFKGSQVKIQAKSGNTTTVQAVDLTVDAVYEIDFTGGNAPEGWSSPMMVTMPKHDGGVTIRFVNMDTVSTHTVHGEDAIPHQETDPLAVATADHAGGVYEVNVPAGPQVSGEYRCHDHEEENMLRTISFNN